MTRLMQWWRDVRNLDVLKAQAAKADAYEVQAAELERTRQYAAQLMADANARATAANDAEQRVRALANNLANRAEAEAVLAACRVLGAAMRRSSQSTTGQEFARMQLAQQLGSTARDLQGFGLGIGNFYGGGLLGALQR